VTRPQGVYLQRGDQGTEVRLLQSSLNQLGYYYGPLNGFFDGPTEVAVRQFQRDNGLVADGIVGSDTRAELRRAIVAYPGNPSYPTNPPITPVPPIGGPTWSSDRYVVVIPSSNGSELSRVRQFAPGAFFVRNNPRGSFINAGASPQIGWANQQSGWLRKSGFDARVVYFRSVL
jgi:peptidoglycan hydrolase-like protein with peptidoglycan-binding domain